MDVGIPFSNVAKIAFEEGEIYGIKANLLMTISAQKLKEMLGRPTMVGYNRTSASVNWSPTKKSLSWSCTSSRSRAWNKLSNAFSYASWVVAIPALYTPSIVPLIRNLRRKR